MYLTYIWSQLRYCAGCSQKLNAAKSMLSKRTLSYITIYPIGLFEKRSLQMLGAGRSHVRCLFNILSFIVHIRQPRHLGPECLTIDLILITHALPAREEPHHAQVAQVAQISTKTSH